MRKLLNFIQVHPGLAAVVFALSIDSGIAMGQTACSSGLSPDVAVPASEGLTAKNEPVFSSSRADLPDAPSPQANASQQGTHASRQEEDHTHINPIDLLSPRLISGVPLSTHDKFEIYIHKTYSPAAVVFPLFAAGIKMANPNDKYPREWQDGMGAFGRIYGDTAARRTATATAEFSTQALLHEDPRYERSSSTNPVVRIGHAVAWTFVDKSDSGKRMFAFSSLTGAAAGGFVGMAYLPDGFNDTTHAEQRMFSQYAGDAVANILTEFEPNWGPLARKLRIPKILPAWWTPDHR